MKDELKQPSDLKHVKVSGDINARFAPEFLEDVKTNQKQEHTRETHRFRVEIATLGVVFVYTLFALWQVCLTRKVISDGREHFIKDQRPYVWLTNNLGGPSFLLPPNGIGPDGYIVWTWHFTNYGKTPAREVRFNHGINIGDDALSKPRTFDQADKPSAPLPPQKDDFSTSVHNEKISPEEFKGLMDSDQTIVVYGRFNYTDASGEQYETGFCILHLKVGAVMYCPDPSSNYIR